MSPRAALTSRRFVLTLSAAAATAVGSQLVAEEPAKEAAAVSTPAQRIVEFRTANGPFKAAEELIAVRGIGEQRFADLRGLVTV